MTETQSAPAPHTFDAYGMKVHSAFDMPELRRLDDSSWDPARSVTVIAGPVPEELDGGERIAPFMAFGKGRCLYTIKGIARFLVSDGATITVDMEPGAAESDMRAYLVGSGYGTLLHQRRVLPLHISAVETPSGVVAFTGQSGAGKSTLAGMLHRRTGWPIVSDDLAVIDPGQDRLQLHTGVTRLKLWKDAIEKFQPEEGSTTRDVARFDKFHINAPELFIDAPGDLTSLILLERGDGPALIPLEGSEGFKAVMTTIYRPELVPAFNDPVAVFRKCGEIASRIQIFTLKRPWSDLGLTQSIDTLIARFARG